MILCCWLISFQPSRSLYSSTCKAYDWNQQKRKFIPLERHCCKQQPSSFDCSVHRTILFELWTKFFFSHELQLGNPVLEFATDLNSRAEYLWSHGLISDWTYKMFTTSCNYSRYVSEYYRDSVSSICSRVMNLVNTETSRFVDKYDVTLDVCIPSILSQSKVLRPQVSPHCKTNCLALSCPNFCSHFFFHSKYLRG